MSETTSANTLPPNSYDKLDVIQFYFLSLPNPTIFDILPQAHHESFEKILGTRKNLAEKLEPELQKIGKIKLLNDKYEVIDEGMISGFNSNSDKTKFGIIMKNGNKHSIDFSIISFDKPLGEIGSKEYIDPKQIPILEPKTLTSNPLISNVGGKKSKQRKSKRRKSSQRKSRRRKSRMI